MKSPHVERRAQVAGAVQRVGDRAGAVVARVVPLPVAAAVLVRLVGDPVAGGDDAAHADRQAAAAAAEPPRRRLRTVVMPGWPSAAHVAGPTMPSAVSPWRALEALDGGLRGGAEDAVDGDPEPSLQQPDAAALARRCRGAAFVVRRECAGAPQRGPRGGADDAVGGQAVAALEALDGALGARAEDPVGVDAQPALHLLHARARASPSSAASPPRRRRWRSRAA